MQIFFFFLIDLNTVQVYRSLRSWVNGSTENHTPVFRSVKIDKTFIILKTSGKTLN